MTTGWDLEWVPQRQFGVEFSFGGSSGRVEEELGRFSSLGDALKFTEAGRTWESFDEIEALARTYGGSANSFPRESRSGRAVRMALNFDSPEGRGEFMEQVRVLYPKPLRVKYSEFDGGYFK